MSFWCKKNIFCHYCICTIKRDNCTCLRISSAFALSLPKIPGYSYICKSRGKRERKFWFSSITGSSSLTGGEAGIHVYKGSRQKWREEGRVRQKNLKTPEGGHYSPESPETGRGGWHSQKFVCAGGGGGLFSIKWLKLIPRNNSGGGKALFWFISFWPIAGGGCV